MLDKRKEELCQYRMSNAEETLKVSISLFEGEHYRDSLNRSYYAVFYALKAVLALEEKISSDIRMCWHILIRAMLQLVKFQESVAEKIAQLQQKREKSDYDDFYIASKEETKEQLENAKTIITLVKEYLKSEKES